MPSPDRDARKQVLLTRIAFERVELRRDVAALKQAASVPQLLRTAVGGALGRSLFGARGAGTGVGGWVGAALTLLRRYRLMTALFGSAVPVLRGGGRWRRILRFGLVGAAAWFGWRATRERRR